MELEFDLLAQPHVTTLPAFRFAHHRVRGPYQPWQRVQALDAVADTLERAEVDRAGPAFGVYYDLPYSETDPAEWRADLGYPVAPGAPIPTRPGLRVREMPPLDVAALRYRGDLGSFPPALQLLVDWAEEQGKDVGPLLERFHVSDALTGAEERDVYLVVGPGLDA
jgi:effector-binding domain-containing protein